MNEKRKEIYRKYYEKNRERILEKSKNATEEEKDRRREWQREYYHAHKAEIAEKRQAEKDKWKQYQKEYYQKRKIKEQGDVEDVKGEDNAESK